MEITSNQAAPLGSTWVFRKLDETFSPDLNWGVTAATFSMGRLRPPNTSPAIWGRPARFSGILGLFFRQARSKGSRHAFGAMS